MFNDYFKAELVMYEFKSGRKKSNTKMGKMSIQLFINAWDCYNLKFRSKNCNLSNKLN